MPLPEIGAIVGSGQERLAASIQPVSPQEMPQDQIIRIQNLLHDIDHLRGLLQSPLEWFLRERDRELGELKRQLLEKLHQTHEQNAHDSGHGTK
jgi:hypothetical protein